MDRVFTALEKAGLKLKASKCDFCRDHLNLPAHGPAFSGSHDRGGAEVLPQADQILFRFYRQLRQAGEAAEAAGQGCGGIAIAI